MNRTQILIFKQNKEVSLGVNLIVAVRRHVFRRILNEWERLL